MNLASIKIFYITIFTFIFLGNFPSHAEVTPSASIQLSKKITEMLLTKMDQIEENELKTFCNESNSCGTYLPELITMIYSNMPHDFVKAHFSACEGLAEQMFQQCLQNAINESSFWSEYSDFIFYGIKHNSPCSEGAGCWPKYLNPFNFLATAILFPFTATSGPFFAASESTENLAALATIKLVRTHLELKLPLMKSATLKYYTSEVRPMLQATELSQETRILVDRLVDSAIVNGGWFDRYSINSSVSKLSKQLVPLEMDLIFNSL